MARRCGCASEACTCRVNAGDGIEVSGTGSTSSPYVISAVGSGLDVDDENVLVQEDATVLNFTGAGVTATAGTGGEVVVTIPGGGGAGGGIAGVNVVQQTFNSSGTWTKLGSLLYVVVELVGGGGGSGGTQATSGGQDAASGAGGGGGYSRKIIQAAALGATETVTVGAGGAAGGNNAAGGTGGTSSFGAHCSGAGGGGGEAGGATGITLATLGGNGGTALDGDLNIPGQAGGLGQVLGGERTYMATGGASHLGHGGRPGRNNVGNPGTAYGGGGGGSTADSNVVSRGGAAGGAGVVIVTAYVTV